MVVDHGLRGRGAAAQPATRAPYPRCGLSERAAGPVDGSVMIRRRLADRAVRWYAGLLAGRALTAATYGDDDAGRDLTARAVRRGPVAVEQLVTVWTEAVLAGLPPAAPAREGVREVPITCGFAIAADAGQRPPTARWVGYLLAAAANHDHAMRRALIEAVPAEDLHDHLAELLRTASDAVVARDDGFWP